MPCKFFPAGLEGRGEVESCWFLLSYIFTSCGFVVFRVARAHFCAECFPIKFDGLFATAIEEQIRFDGSTVVSCAHDFYLVDFSVKTKATVFQDIRDPKFRTSAILRC